MRRYNAVWQSDLWLSKSAIFEHRFIMSHSLRILSSAEVIIDCQEIDTPVRENDI